MFFEMIATFVAGFGAAGLALLVNKITGGRLPRWSTPVAAGAAMLLFTIWSEMTWAERTTQSLPDGLVKVHSVEQTYYWKPWTFVTPQVTRFITADTASRRDNPDAPGTLLVDLYLHARWSAVQLVPQFVDCNANARADVTDAALADPQANADWIKLETSDPLIEVICQT